MKLIILCLFLLSVKLADSPDAEFTAIKQETDTERDSSEGSVPRKLKSYDLDEDKRKLSLITQNMAKSLNLSTGNPYSIDNSLGAGGFGGNGVADLQRLQQEIAAQNLQSQIPQMQSKFRRRSSGSIDVSEPVVESADG